MMHAFDAPDAMNDPQRKAMSAWSLHGIYAVLLTHALVILAVLHGGLLQQEPLETGLSAGVVCANVIAWFIHERGDVRWASLIMLTSVWCHSIGYIGLTGVGLDQPLFTIFPVLIVGSGLFFGAYASWVFALASAAGATLVWLYVDQAPNNVALVAILLVDIAAAAMTHNFRRLLDDARQREAARASEREALFTQSPVGLLVLDEDERVLDANPAAAALLRTAKLDQAEGLEFASLGLRCDAGRPVTSPRHTRSKTCMLGSGQGARDVELVTRPIGEDEDRTLLALVDVTESRRAARERARLMLSSERAQRLEAMGRMAGEVAHDINNVLGAVGGFAQLLVADAQDESTKELAEEIVLAQERGASMTRQLLAFARREPGAPRRLDLSELVARITPMLERLIAPTTTLLVEHDAQCFTFADPTHIEQILLNLVVNANDALEGRPGRVTIAAKSSDDGRCVELSVSDDGHGMPEEVRLHAFEPFFTTKPEGKGTGLGLATVHGLVTQNKGSIELESAPGRGTTFTISLKRERDISMTFSDEDVGWMRARGQGKSILIVDDEDVHLRLLSRVLTRQGYTVHMASDGADALDAYFATHQRPDIVLTDVRMPNVGGAELARRLQERDASARILFMSGCVDLHSWTLEPLLQKPLDLRELLTALHEAVAPEPGDAPLA